jgi:hypothetical protein
MGREKLKMGKGNKMKKGGRKTKKSGFFWHVHHDTLLEWSDDINKRIEFIKTKKPANEIETRLKLLQRVKGELPEEVIGTWNACKKVEDTFYKAQDAYDKARNACYKAWDARLYDIYKKAWNVYNKAYDAYKKAWDAHNEAIVDHLPEIELLHKQECRNCPLS